MREEFEVLLRDPRESFSESELLLRRIVEEHESLSARVALLEERKGPPLLWQPEKK